MNEYERRVLDLAQNNMNLREAAAAEGRLSLIEYFGYSTQIGSRTAPVLSGEDRQAVIPIQADSYFVLSYIIASEVYTGAPEFVEKPADFTLQITDTGAGKTLYSSPTVAELLVGGANAYIQGIPLLLAVPRVIRPNTNVKIDINNFGPNSLAGIFISLFGAKVYAI